MSSFTNHTAIYPSENLWQRINAEAFRYYIGEDGSNDYVDIPAWYEFDWASVPKILGIFIQKVETDTIASSCLHDYLYTDYRKYGRIKSDLIFYESLMVYNIPKLLKQKEYITAFICTIKYAIMTMWLILFSWIVWYKLEKRFIAFIGNLWKN
jgi:hypothetical protein